MYIPNVAKPRPILFDLGDTLVNFSETNPFPHFREGTRLAYEHMQKLGIKLPSFKSYLRSARRTTILAYAVSELQRREVDLLIAMQKLHHLRRLPEDEEFLLELAEHFYEPMKRLGTVEEGLPAILDQLLANKHPIAIVSNTMVQIRF